MEFKDYYQTLAVPRSASADEIKKSYRALARKFHPDVSRVKDAEARMKEVNEAYAVLSDPEKRAAYDQLGQAYRPGQEFRPPSDWDAGFEFSGQGFAPGAGTDFSDFFAELFGRMGGTRPGGREGFKTRGEDHHAKVAIDLKDAWNGGTRQISPRVPRQEADGRVTLTTRTLNLRIPQGVKQGQMIRLAGQGASGVAGGPNGDLYLEVHIRPQRRFRVDGRDLHVVLPVAPWEAALGATIAIDLPAGNSVKVRIPEGAQSGRQLKVKGRGVPGKPPGDLYLEIRVVVPDAKNEQARKIYELMARELAFDPRAHSDA